LIYRATTDTYTWQTLAAPPGQTFDSAPTLMSVAAELGSPNPVTSFELIHRSNGAVQFSGGSSYDPSLPWIMHVYSYVY
jgi:hypothetical protein